MSDTDPSGFLVHTLRTTDVETRWGIGRVTEQRKRIRRIKRIRRRDIMSDDTCNRKASIINWGRREDGVNRERRSEI